jgi:hypothetical protein
MVPPSFNAQLCFVEPDRRLRDQSASYPGAVVEVVEVVEVVVEVVVRVVVGTTRVAPESVKTTVRSFVSSPLHPHNPKPAIQTTTRIVLSPCGCSLSPSGQNRAPLPDKRVHETKKAPT